MKRLALIALLLIVSVPAQATSPTKWWLRDHPRWFIVTADGFGLHGRR